MEHIFQRKLWRDGRSRLLSVRHLCIHAQNPAVLARFARARDRSHSHSSALASCDALPAPSMEPSGRRKHVRAKRARTSYLQDVGKGREQERKLEASPRGNNSTNCIFGKTQKIMQSNAYSPISSVIVQNAG